MIAVAYEEFGRYMARRALSDNEDCEIVGFSGEGRCLEPAVAVRWEDGHADNVCEGHSQRAIQRGALVIR